MTQGEVLDLLDCFYSSAYWLVSPSQPGSEFSGWSLAGNMDAFEVTALAAGAHKGETLLDRLADLDVRCSLPFGRLQLGAL